MDDSHDFLSHDWNKIIHTKGLHRRCTGLTIDTNTNNRWKPYLYIVDQVCISISLQKHLMGCSPIKLHFNCSLIFINCLFTETPATPPPRKGQPRAIPSRPPRTTPVTVTSTTRETPSRKTTHRGGERPRPPKPPRTTHKTDTSTTPETPSGKTVNPGHERPRPPKPPRRNRHPRTTSDTAMSTTPETPSRTPTIPSSERPRPPKPPRPTRLRKSPPGVEWQDNRGDEMEKTHTTLPAWTMPLRKVSYMKQSWHENLTHEHFIKVFYAKNSFLSIWKKSAIRISFSCIKNFISMQKNDFFSCMKPFLGTGMAHLWLYCPHDTLPTNTIFNSSFCFAFRK